MPDTAPTGTTRLIAAPLAGRALADAVWRAWDDGHAILPLNPAAPAAERERLLAALRPDEPVADSPGSPTHAASA